MSEQFGDRPTTPPPDDDPTGSSRAGAPGPGSPTAGRPGTSPPGTGPSDGGHLSAEELADLDEGLLVADRAAAATAHLDSCATCRATRTELAELTGLLATALDDRLPAAIARRLDEVLAREVASRTAERATAVGPVSSPMPLDAAERAPAADPSRAAARPSAPVTSLATARTQRAGAARWRRAAASAVGVAAVLGGGFLFLQTPPGDDSDSGSATDSAGSAGQESAEDMDTGTLAEAPMTAEGDLPGFAYTESTLVSDAARLVATEASPERTADSPAASDGQDDSPAPTSSVDTTSCEAAVSAAALGTTRTLAVDVGTYEGRRAVVVVRAERPAAADDAEVWVVDADCLEAPADADLEVLQRVPLPQVTSAR